MSEPQLDLATAMVNLGVAAEKRRETRKQLRESVDVIAATILKHTRVGDMAIVDDDWAPHTRVYTVEQVGWEVECHYENDDFARTDSDTTKAALVQYTFDVRYAENATLDDVFSADGEYRGAVVGDVRSEYELWSRDLEGPVGVAKPVGVRFWRDARADQSPYQAELHLATDRELSIFADEAVEVVRQFSDYLRGESVTFASVSKKLTKLAPR